MANTVSGNPFDKPIGKRPIERVREMDNKELMDMEKALWETDREYGLRGEDKKLLRLVRNEVERRANQLNNKGDRK